MTALAPQSEIRPIDPLGIHGHSDDPPESHSITTQ
jgi:hypothetical protein